MNNVPGRERERGGWREEGRSGLWRGERIKNTRTFCGNPIPWPATLQPTVAFDERKTMKTAEGDAHTHTHTKTQTHRHTRPGDGREEVGQGSGMDLGLELELALALALEMEL